MSLCFQYFMVTIAEWDQGCLQGTHTICPTGLPSHSDIVDNGQTIHHTLAGCSVLHIVLCETANMQILGTIMVGQDSHAEFYFVGFKLLMLNDLA